MAFFRVNEPQIIHQTVDEETVIVDLGSGSYYSLRGSAQVIWGALDRGLDVPGVIREVGGRFDGDDIAHPVEAFVTKLVDGRLIVPIDGERRGDTDAPSNDGDRFPAAGERQAFEPPVLERFDDLQDLILLDPVHDVSEEQGWPHARTTDGG